MTTTPQPICPHCGYSLHRDEPIERDGWRIPPYGGVTGPGGVAVYLTPQQTELLHAIAAVQRPLSPHALSSRIDAQSGNHVQVCLTRIRKACKAAGVAVPFAALGYGRGWAWSAGA